ncbi:MAG: flagellar filament capping protein FliD [Pseudodesulfovibrio sp.]|nr:flagellar filament capping protein FliD [Pseudodesulfovibrio sp.]
MGYVSSVSSDVTAYTPISTAGEVTFSGLGNGTDFQEIIDVTVAAEGFKKDDYEAQKEETEYLIDLLEQLEDGIENLNDSLDEMDEPDEFYSLEGSSSGDEVDVKVAGKANEGIHTLVVDQLAQKDVWVNTAYGFDSENDVIAATATTMEFTHQGETISIDIAAGTTLNGLVTTINGSMDTRDKVEADLLFDGNKYYFVLNSEDSGADNAITITNTGTLSNFDLTNFTNTQTGQNSRIKVDGFPADANSWIERDTNSVDDVVDGVTFDLKETTAAEGVRITIEYDTDAMTETIETFVTDVNQIILDMQTLTGRLETDDDEEEAYTIDNYALDIMYNKFKSILSSGALGFSRYTEADGGDPYNALSQIGITTDAEDGSDTFGQLLLDDDILEEALENDPEAVALLFSSRAVGESDSDDFQVISVIDTVTPPGEHTVEYTVSGGLLVSATINGQEAEIDGWTILGKASDSSGLYISIGNQTDGTHSETVRVKQGKIGELSESLSTMTNDETGTLPILIENYEASITSFDNQIYNEEQRLDSLEKTLIKKYAALDSTLSYYDNLGATLESLTANF